MKDKQKVEEMEVIKNILRLMVMALLASFVVIIMLTGLIFAFMYAQAVRELPQDLKACNSERIFCHEN